MPSIEDRMKLLSQRVERAFGPSKIVDVVGGRKAIIGPARLDLLVEDASEARQLLLIGRPPTACQLASLEQAIRLQRPAPVCKQDGLTGLPEEGNWLQAQWTAFQPRLQNLQRGVAKLERVDDPNPVMSTGKTLLGTGFLVEPGVLLTAAHVVDELSLPHRTLQRGQAVADFGGYSRSWLSDLFDIVDVIKLDAKLDLALLRIEPVSSNGATHPVLMPVASRISPEQAICVLGYPLEDSRNPSDFVCIVFDMEFGVKRAAIGEVIEATDTLFFHDCSTMGGNSGSPVIDISTGQVCGVHISGTAMIRNEAIPGEAAHKFISRSLRPTSSGSSTQRRSNMKRDKVSFDKYYMELQKYDPELRREMDAAVKELESKESADSRTRQFNRETIVLRKGRPVLDIKSGAMVIDIQEVESQIWKQRLKDANRLLAPNIPAVGRIELMNHPRGVEWLGTGWLLRNDVVVTNRHVAEIFGAERDGEFVFRPGFEEGPIDTSIDFLKEFGNTASRAFPLFKIVHIERADGPDLAFLRIEPVNGQSLPTPVMISPDEPQEGDQVAVVGYPGRDPFFPEPLLMDSIFRNRYDRKRLAPGLIIGKNPDRLFHDCTTLGGNSGGEVVSLKNGGAVGLHFAGTLFTKNHAVPIDVVTRRLDQVLNGRPLQRPRPSGSSSDEQHSRQSTMKNTNASRVIEATIPIKVRIEIGDAVVNSPVNLQVSSPVKNPVNLDADDDLIEMTEGRKEDYLDREGFSTNFLGEEVPLPTLTRNQDDVLTYSLEGETQSVLPYFHFSVLMSESRRMCRYSACNIDGKQSQRTSRARWQFDPRISREAQIMKECYGNLPKFSRGHMTRREDPAWGDDADLGNRDSMHVTNTVPQIQAFNGGIWNNLEDYALQNARKDDMRICVITGPFLEDNDPERFGVQVPVEFWKIIAFIHDETGKLCATGYTMSQRSFIGEEEFVFGRFENHQRPISEIEKRAGISFGPLAAIDPLKDVQESIDTLLTDPNQIRFR